MLIFSGAYEEAVTKGRQNLLRYKANQIADHEALYHIHLWNHGPDPQYIYYIIAISKDVFPFFFFLLIVVMAFANTMYNH